MDTEPILHENLPLLEVTDPVFLDALYADPRTEMYLLTRLSERVAVIAPASIDKLEQYLLKQGHTPKILK
jgi:hypothetical protein